MKVGVLLPSRFEDPGEFISDARAMEAAGVDSVWMEDDGGHDPLLALAAIAAVTGQLCFGLILANSSSAFESVSWRGSRRYSTCRAVEAWSACRRATRL